MLKNIKEKYHLDFLAILLFAFVSLSFPAVYKWTLPLIITFSLFQFYRLKASKISLDVLIVTNFYLLVFSLPFFRSVHTAILIINLAVLAYGFFLNRQEIKSKAIKFEIYILLFFVLIVINQLIHVPRMRGFETFLYLLFYPLMTILLKKQGLILSISKLVRVYISAVLISLIYLFCINLFYGKIGLQTNTFFSEYLGMIHVYYGLVLGLAACLILALQNKKKYYIARRTDIVLLLIFFGTLIYIGARIALLGFIVVALISIFFSIRAAWYLKGAMMFIFLVGMLSLAYVTIPRAKNDIDYIVKVYESVKTGNSEDIKHNSWRNMYKRFLVVKYTLAEVERHYLFGIGNKNVKEKISDKIIADGYLYFKPLNSHNQYLHFLIGMGIPSFLYFLWLLFKFIKERAHDRKALYFSCFFLTIMLTESVLMRNKGIATFFLFYLIFSLNGLGHKLNSRV